MSTVVVLNGTSSSGKTTVARAFQDAAPRLFLNFSIDHILDALPHRAIERMKSSSDPGDLDYRALVGAYYACVRQLLDLGHDLVIDNAVTTLWQAEFLVDAVASHDVLLVAVDCPPEVLAERERNRGDRRPGLAVQQQTRIHSWLEYDLRIDTSNTDERDAATRIVQALEQGARGAFATTRQRVASGSASS